MRIHFIFFALFISTALTAQNLKSFNVNMRPDSTAFLSIKNAKAYTRGNAESVKGTLDLAMILTMDDKTPVIEWYNLKTNNEKVPATLWGTQTKVVSIGFDRDQFDKCKTTADLKRMTGYMTTNSFSHFATIRNGDNAYQPCFIFEKEDGKRGLLFMTPLKGNNWKVEVKSE